MSASPAQPSASPSTTDAGTARERLAALVAERAVVRGRVTLASGKEADHYVDLRRTSLDGEAAPLVGPVMLDLVADWEFDAVGGLTLGADPVALAMLHTANAAGWAAAHGGRPLDAFVVRKAEKTHGLQRRIEGPDVAGRRVLAVEDTSTTGGSVLTAVEALREAGATVVGVAVIVDRDTGARERVEAAGLEYRAAFGPADIGLGA
ncbi:orotate phosphoribosyltransferase [Kineococcus sp. NUM-3379]